MGVVKCEPGSCNGSCITSNDDDGDGGGYDDDDAEEGVAVKDEEDTHGDVDQNSFAITFKPMKSENGVSFVCVRYKVIFTDM
jgi:hypothetical protein